MAPFSDEYLFVEIANKVRILSRNFPVYVFIQQFSPVDLVWETLINLPCLSPIVCSIDVF